MRPSTSHSALTIGFALLALVSRTSGLVTETSASNKPPFSFPCTTIALSESKPECKEKPFARIEKIGIHRDGTAYTYGDCLDPEKDALARALSNWFNVECRKPLLERPEETYRVPMSDLHLAIENYCQVTPSTITKIVVDYDCAKTLKETEELLIQLARNRSSTAGLRTTKRPQALATTTTAGVDKGNGIAGRTTSSKSPPNSRGLTADESTLLIILLPTSIVLLIVIISVLWFCCCYWKRHDEQRKTSVASGLSVPRQSAVFLVPASNKSGGEGIDVDGELFVVPAYEGPAAAVEAAADATAFGVNGQQHVVADRGRRSIDRRSVSIALVDGTDGQRRASLVSRQLAAESSALPVAYLIDAAPEGLMTTQLGSRRSSVVVDHPSAGVFYDQRRRQSTTSASSSDALRRSSIDASGRSGSLSAAAVGGPVVENRKLSLTSYAELPSSDRRGSGGGVYYSGGAEQQQRRVSLVLPTSDERRLSDGGGGSGSRRATATGAPSMPGIDELHESIVASAVTASTIAAAAAVRGNGSRRASADEEMLYRSGSRSHSLDGGAAVAPPQSAQQQWRRIYGRQSWSGEATDEGAAPSSPRTNYAYWPSE